MTMASYNAVMDFDVDHVWAVLPKFGEISAWHPAIPERVIEDGEQLLMVDDCRQSFAYCFLGSPLPLDNYVAAVAVLPQTRARPDRVAMECESRCA